MKGKRVVFLMVVLFATSLVATARAGAATVTIGSPLTSTFTNNPAGGTGTNAMVSGPNLASPVDGTVINWRTQEFFGNLRVRVLKLSAGNAAVAVASSSPIALNGGTVDTPLNLSIHAGEIVGFDNTSPTDRADVANSTQYSSAFWLTLSDNATPQPPNDDAPIEFAYNATVRYCVVPNLRGKKLGAARKALADASCTLGKVTKKKAKKGKKKGKKVVVSQSVAPGSSISDQAPIDVKVKKKKPKK